MKISVLAGVAPSMILLGIFGDCTVALAQSAPNNSATAQDDSSFNEIVVTAERHSERINSVPATITAITGDKLIQQGISSPEDLVRVVPSLQVANSGFSLPIYTLRGIGFTDHALASTSTVAIYTDEIPLPFPAMTTGAAFDLERLEVLEGPQGTLYGSNSTGGAINYISAKPTNHFETGGFITFGRFDRVDAEGYVSGPLTDTVRARVAIQTRQGGDWQYNYARDALAGAQDQTKARVLLDWNPSENLTVLANLNGWYDKSDTQRPQAISYLPRTPGNIPALSPTLQQLIPNQPISPQNDRAANWAEDSPVPLSNDNTFFQTSLRADYRLTQALTLTSLSSFEQTNITAGTDLAGTTITENISAQRAMLKALTQELRLTGDFDKLRLIVGGNFQHDDVVDNGTPYITQSTVSITLGLPLLHSDQDSVTSDSNYAAFMNADYELTNRLKFHGGVRYTSDNRDFSGCAADSGNGQFAAVINKLAGIFSGGTAPQNAVAGGCGTLLPDFSSGRFYTTLDEHNISWRGGMDYTFENGGLVYGNISRGFKQGSFPTFTATNYTQYTPAKQEELTAYELGLKQPLDNRSVQVNGAVFYYDYLNKQLLGNGTNPIFGFLQKLVNVPKSRVYGAETQLTWAPRSGLLQGLQASGAATYVNSKIKGDWSNYDSFGAFRNFGGDPFPYTPEWSANADLEYDWSLGNGLKPFVGTSANYNGATFAGLGELGPQRIDSYALVDLRAGVGSADGRWRLTLWGRNITDKYYWTNTVRYVDYFARYAGQPATFGITINGTF